METLSQQQEVLHLAAEKTDNSRFFNEKVKNTIFNIVGKNEELVITIGDTVVSEKIFKNVKDAIKYINSKPWELILVSSHVFISKVNNNLNLIKNESEEATIEEK